MVHTANKRWPIIQDILKREGIARQHLNSFDEFLERGLQSIINEVGQIEIENPESSLQFGTSVVQPDSGQGGLTFTADAPVGAIAIGIDGNTDHTHTDITLVVTAPNGNVITVDQITPNQKGDFNTVIEVGCASWEQDGFYTITAQQGESSFYESSAEVEIKDCVVVPEFGTIAVLILAVAIVSIIAVTSRSKLSVIPKF